VNVNLLIDAIVRQTTVLIAQLATTSGSRAQLAHTANQVFLDLVRELKDQGLANKVIADMFGLTLRTYHNKISRLAESSTERGRSLWEALLTYVQEHGTVRRVDLLIRFSGDDEATIRGVLKDLVDSGMLFRSGRGDRSTYRAASPEDVSAEAGGADLRMANFAWVAIHRYGPITRSELAAHVPAGEDPLDAALAKLVSDGRVTASETEGRIHYRSAECVIPIGTLGGWEAAVFDHYQAMVTALCTKLRLGKTHATADEWIGGSTYGFAVWEGHPEFAEATGFLKETRSRAVAIRKRVEAYNAGHAAPEGALRQVIAYVGQTVLGLEDEGDDE
jgi:hypothetical protein